MKTKVTEFLDEKGVSYKLLPHDKEVFTCEEAAKVRGVEVEAMVKSLLLVDKEKKYVLACLLAPYRVDTKKVRKAVSFKELRFSTMEEVKEIMGYTMGAVPPLLSKTEIPIVFDELILKKEKVNISAGDPMAGMELKSKDLVDLVNPIVKDIKKL